jgi:hypothetical protein
LNTDVTALRRALKRAWTNDTMRCTTLEIAEYTAFHTLVMNDLTALKIEVTVFFSTLNRAVMYDTILDMTLIQNDMIAFHTDEMNAFTELRMFVTTESTMVK